MSSAGLRRHLVHSSLEDFGPYTGILPYASEIFGVYQPMLGWKSRRILSRIERGFAHDKTRLYDRLYGKLVGKFEVSLNADRVLEKIQSVEPAIVDEPEARISGSFVMDVVARQLPSLDEFDEDDEGVWQDAINEERIRATLRKDVVSKTSDWYRGAVGVRQRNGESIEALNAAVTDQLSRESAAEPPDPRRVERHRIRWRRPCNRRSTSQHLLDVVSTSAERSYRFDDSAPCPKDEKG